MASGNAWLAWLEPALNVAPRAQASCVVELASKSNQRRLAASLEKLGARVAFARSEDDAHDSIDDLREICSACEGGRGRHRCASCQSLIFIATATASLDHRKEPSR